MRPGARLTHGRYASVQHRTATPSNVAMSQSPARIFTANGQHSRDHTQRRCDQTDAHMQRHAARVTETRVPLRRSALSSAAIPLGGGILGAQYVRVGQRIEAMRTIAGGGSGRRPDQRSCRAW